MENNYHGQTDLTMQGRAQGLFCFCVGWLCMCDYYIVNY